MATMAINMNCRPMYDFDIAEKQVVRVEAGLTFAQGMSIVIRTCFSFVHLTGAFHTAVKVQDDLICKLVDPLALKLTSAQLIDIADKIEHLVKINEHILANATDVPMLPWGDYIEQLKAQCERLDSIAESFRLSASESFNSYVGDLIREAEENTATEESWRDFVATLHD